MPFHEEPVNSKLRSGNAILTKAGIRSGRFEKFRRHMFCQWIVI